MPSPMLYEDDVRYLSEKARFLMNPNLLHILILICDEGAIRNKDLAKWSGLDKAIVSIHTKKLLELDLIQWTTDDNAKLFSPRIKPNLLYRLLGTLMEF